MPEDWPWCTTGSASSGACNCFSAPESGSTSGISDGTRGAAAVDLSDYGQRMRNAYNFRNSRKSWDAIHELQAAEKSTQVQ